MFRSFCYHKHCVKRVRIRSYSGLHFSRIFPPSDWIRRNISPYSVRMRENVRKTRITPNTNTFYAVKKNTSTHLNRNICLIFSACLLQEWSLIINIFSKSVSIIQAELLRHGFHLEKLLVLCDNCQFHWDIFPSHKQSLRGRSFYQKLVLENFAEFTGNHPEKD